MPDKSKRDKVSLKVPEAKHGELTQVREDIHRRWRTLEATLQADCIKASGRHEAARQVHDCQAYGGLESVRHATLQAMGRLQEAYEDHAREANVIDCRRAGVDRTIIQLTRTGSEHRSPAEQVRLSLAMSQRNTLEVEEQELACDGVVSSCPFLKNALRRYIGMRLRVHEDSLGPAYSGSSEGRRLPHSLSSAGRPRRSREEAT